MDVERYLLSLIAPAKAGDEIGSGVVFEGVSADAGPRFLFRAGGAPVVIEVSRIEDGRVWAARSKHFGFAYRSESSGIRVDSRVGVALCRAVANTASRNEDEVLSGMAGDAAKAEELGEAGARIRMVRIEKALSPAMDRGRAFYSLNPYAGCLIGCRFCYAQDRVADLRHFAGISSVPAWGSYVDVRINAPDVLAEELCELVPNPIKFCPIISDPYQRVEEKYQITRKCLQAIFDAGRGFSVIVLTRSVGMLRDLKLLAALPNTFAGVSIPTVDDGVRAHFEPRAAPIGERLALLERLRAEGIRTFAVVQPILPGPLDVLADALAERVSSVSAEVLRGVLGAEREFSDARYAEAREPSWQNEKLAALSEHLRQRGLRIWEGELPPDMA